MASAKPRPYSPDVAIPPGTTILEMLEEKGITQAGLAERMKRPANKINEILNGKRAITAETAMELELVLGLPAYFWLELESNYQLARKRLKAMEDIQEQTAILKQFPVREMIRLGWLEKMDSLSGQTHKLLSFLGVASFSQLDKPSVFGAAFRKSELKEACPYAMAAWLRKGELEAAEIETRAFDAKGLKSSLGKLRSMTLLPPGQFRPRLVAICAAHGVAVVFVPHLPKSYVCGAAYWLGDKAVIQLSFRFRTNDHFWFSFFHELGHILLHGKREKFIDDFKDAQDDKEQEANLFACEALIPASEYNRLRALKLRSRTAIKEFSQQFGIAPGIVIGRLQHDNVILHNTMNDLKVRIDWNQEPGIVGAEC
jgi:HTH-type transcriptional regulator/antitoxin HigA